MIDQPVDVRYQLGDQTLTHVRHSLATVVALNPVEVYESGLADANKHRLRQTEALLGFRETHAASRLHIG